MSIAMEKKITDVSSFIPIWWNLRLFTKTQYAFYILFIIYNFAFGIYTGRQRNPVKSSNLKNDQISRYVNMRNDNEVRKWMSNRYFAIYFNCVRDTIFSSFIQGQNNKIHRIKNKVIYYQKKMFSINHKIIIINVCEPFPIINY